MEKFKGTPGPWVANSNRVYFEITSDLGGIGNVFMSGHEFDSGNCLGPTAEANANLIAAAPDLLEALQDILWELRVNGEVSTQNKKDARAAIARALGKNDGGE